jgi:hypothetical protein
MRMPYLQKAESHHKPACVHESRLQNYLQHVQAHCMCSDDAKARDKH